MKQIFMKPLRSFYVLTNNASGVITRWEKELLLVLYDWEEWWKCQFF